MKCSAYQLTTRVARGGLAFIFKVLAFIFQVLPAPGWKMNASTWKMSASTNSS